MSPHFTGEETEAERRGICPRSAAERGASLTVGTLSFTSASYRVGDLVSQAPGKAQDLKQ